MPLVTMAFELEYEGVRWNWWPSVNAAWVTAMLLPMEVVTLRDCASITERAKNSRSAKYFDTPTSINAFAVS